MLVTDPKINVEKNGFLNIEVDPELDLFAEIERLKKEKVSTQRVDITSFIR